MDIYTNVLYPLSRREIDELDNTWIFLESFKQNQTCSSLHLYRSQLIDHVCTRYTCEQFYNYELLAEKLFWNLRARTQKYFPENHLVSGSLDDMYNNLINDNSYRSFINKLILINDSQNEYFYKKIEGSSHIFNKNDFNTITGYLLFNRQLYENIITNPQKILDVNMPRFYYEYDYGFPNLNYGKPFIQSSEFRLKRINKMYYDDNAESNWFRLIRPDS